MVRTSVENDVLWKKLLPHLLWELHHALEITPIEQSDKGPAGCFRNHTHKHIVAEGNNTTPNFLFRWRRAESSD